MATPRKPLDPDKLRQRLLRIIEKDVEAMEAQQKAGQTLDPKQAALAVQYTKQLTEVLNEEERWARKALSEAAKLGIPELEKRAAGEGSHGEALEQD